MNWLDGVSITLMNADLDGLWARQKAISDNIANVETTGYKCKKVSFEDQLEKALSQDYTNKDDLTESLQQTKAVTTVSNDESLRSDGNNVDIDAENIELARTQLNYLYSLQEIKDQFSRLKYAITGS